MVLTNMTSTLVFIFENSEILEFLNSIKTTNNLKIISSNDEIKKEILEYGYDCKTINEYTTDSVANLQKAIQWIKNWPDQQVLDGKNFKEFLLYEHFTIFWFLEMRFYLYRIQTLIPVIEQIKSIFLIENPDVVWVKGNKDVFHIINELFKSKIKKIKFTSNNTTSKSINFKSYSGNRFLKLLLLKFLRSFFQFTSNLDDNNPVLIITEMGYWRNEFDYVEKKIIKKDVIFDSIIKKLSNSKIPLRIIDFENQPKQLIKSFYNNIKREKSLGVKVEPWEKYITKDILKKTKQYNDNLEIFLPRLINSEEFKKSLNYQGISLYEILKDDIIRLLQSFKTYTSVTFIETAKNILDTIKPSVIMMHDEYGTLQLSIIKEAARRKIPTISIQHGVNTETWMSYIHKPEHVSNKNNDLNFPLPDKLCVWSETAKNNLIKFGNFSTDIPVVTGDPKTDFLSHVITQFDKEEILSKLNIPQKNRIILFATQNISQLNEKELMTKTVFETVSHIENSFLIIKAHPNETNLSFYKKIADQQNIKNFIVLQFHNLYELIHISDVVVVSFSTVGFEAMRLRKPVICLNLLSLHDDDPLIKSHIPIIINSSHEFIPAIKKCLDSKKIIQMLDDQESLAEKEIGKFDGNASSRIFNLIIEMKKNHTNV